MPGGCRSPLPVRVVIAGKSVLEEAMDALRDLNVGTVKLTNYSYENKLMT